MSAQLHSETDFFTLLIPHDSAAILRAGKPLIRWVAGWVRDLRFYVFSTVFQSYQDDGLVIMNHVNDWTGIRLVRGLDPGPLHQ